MKIDLDTNTIFFFINPTPVLLSDFLGLYCRESLPFFLLLKHVNTLKLYKSNFVQKSKLFRNMGYFNCGLKIKNKPSIINLKL